MTDTREDILVRLLEVVATVPNVKSVRRNDVDTSETSYPVAVVFDGDEETDDTQNLNRPSNSPMLVDMMPQIVIGQQTDQVGSDINVFRRELIKRVLSDTQLNNLVAKSSPRGNGAIRYHSSQVYVGWMREMYGALQVNFTFKYTLRPDDL